ncbi:MAG: ADP-ribosylglycohydrolase family protein [Candidatus Hydrogenedentes bacterium]|nr:ADP-ribosylglycohydrolase family protein [Candidatus Hydrogenedentota bacterium]
MWLRSLPDVSRRRYTRVVDSHRYIGCLLGTAVGDALGLPAEGISARRHARLFHGPLRHRFLPGKGLVSDDTDHAVFVAQALVRAGLDSDAFQRALSWSLRWWLAGIPAGVGLATLRATLRLWLGISPRRSGVFSAGNGPAMRSPILGVRFGDEKGLLHTFVRRSTELTHSDPKAFHGALAIALAAHHSAAAGVVSGRSYLEALREHLSTEQAVPFLELMERAVQSASVGESSTTFAASLGCTRGVTGYMYHTVPCVVQTWLRHPNDFAAGIEAIISAGGDTDTTGAILGGIVGARVGKEGIPAAWLNGILEWPRSTIWMEHLACSLAEVAESGKPLTPPPYFFPGVLPRNLFLLSVVLAHGLRRLAPPY